MKLCFLIDPHTSAPIQKTSSYCERCCLCPQAGGTKDAFICNVAGAIVEDKAVRWEVLITSARKSPTIAYEQQKYIGESKDRIGEKRQNGYAVPARDVEVKKRKVTWGGATFGPKLRFKASNGLFEPIHTEWKDVEAALAYAKTAEGLSQFQPGYTLRFIVKEGSKAYFCGPEKCPDSEFQNVPIGERSVPWQVTDMSEVWEVNPGVLYRPVDHS